MHASLGAGLLYGMRQRRMIPVVKWHKIASLSPKILADERGYILGLVMIFFIVFSIIGLSVLKMGGLERLQSFNYSQKEKAFYHAAGGIHKGLWLVNKVSNAAATFSDSTVSVVYDSVGLILTATGTAGNAQKAIQATLKNSAGDLKISGWLEL